nr:hypothetical protein [Tanacetum cinerariifolium]
MDARLSANSESDAFKNFSKSICLEGAGYATDTVLRLDSPGSVSASKGVKRKWSVRDGSIDMDAELPLCLWFGRSSSSSDSKASSATAMSSPKETNEESSMDIDLDFCLHLGGEKVPVRNKVSSNKVSMDCQDEVDLELSLSSTPAESDISTVHSNCNFEKIPLTVGGEFYMNKASVSSSNGILLMNAGEFPEMDPYEEVAQQGQDDDGDPEEDPSREHEPEDDDEDPKEDPNEEHELEDEDTKEPFEGSDETGPFEEDETALINAFTVGSSPFLLPPTSPAYDQAPLGHRTTMIRMRDDIPEEDMPPRRRFVLTTPPPECDVAESSAAASERRTTTSIEEVKLRVSYQAQVRMQESMNFYTQFLDAWTERKDIRLEIDVRQSAEDLTVTQMMRIHTLEAKARTDTVEDASSSC